MSLFTGEPDVCLRPLASSSTSQQPPRADHTVPGERGRPQEHIVSGDLKRLSTTIALLVLCALLLSSTPSEARGAAKDWAHAMSRVAFVPTRRSYTISLCSTFSCLVTLLEKYVGAACVHAVF